MDEKKTEHFWKWKNRTFVNEAGEQIQERTLYLNGNISDTTWFDDDVTPQMFKDELMDGDGDVTVFINSPGGDCVAASRIYTMLMEYPHNVTVKIDGLAASAASVIAMAGTKTLMAPTALMMIHDPSTFAYGDTKEMEAAISMLNEVKESIINAYEIKSGMSRNKISKLMSQETWLNANKAMELGLADGILKRNFDEDAEDLEIPEVSMLYTPMTIQNSLRKKIAKACHIEPKQEEETRVKASDLTKRLEDMKYWR